MTSAEDESRTSDADRDLSTLEAAERELADLERELDRAEDSDEPTAT